MSMHPNFFPQQRRRFNVNTWMPQSSNVFGMSPLESYLMPSMLDIFEPLLNLSRSISVGPQRQRGWSQPRNFGQNVSNVRSKSQTPRMIGNRSYGGAIGGFGIQNPMLSKKTTVSKNMPQKYRITIDCCGFDQKAIRTFLKPVNGVYHLIVSCCNSGSQSQGVSAEFRRSYTLPRNCDIKKMCVCMFNGVCVIEFPLLEQPVLSKCTTIKPTVVKYEGTKMVTLRVPIPEEVNRANLQCYVKDRDLIMRFEYKIVPGHVSRVYCYTKVPLPAQANISQLKCKLNKKRLLTVYAPVLTKTTARPSMVAFRCIHIERKLRHRITGKLPLIQREIFAGKSIQKKKTPTIGGGVEKKPYVGKQQQPQIGGKQWLGGDKQQQIGGGVGKPKFGSQPQFGGKTGKGITKPTSGLFSDLFSNPKQPVTGKDNIFGGKTADVPNIKTPVVPKKKSDVEITRRVVKPTPTGVPHGQQISGQSIEKTRTGSNSNIKKTSSGKNLFEGGKVTKPTKRIGEEPKRSGPDSLHQIIGRTSPERKSPERKLPVELKSPEIERRGSPEGRKSPTQLSRVL